MKKFLTWLDEHILLILASFLLAFIPLYPKIPLFEAIPGYIVRVRLEDVFILLTLLVYFIQFLRKKVIWQSKVAKLIFAYLVVAGLSIFSATFLIKTIPLEWLHVGKTLLHWFRYMEYFSLFFVLYAAIKKPLHFRLVIVILAVTTLAISIYGYGQRYFYWPVYSTMNREFSKGVRLYLTEHARVQSTFGGHYDLAAYLVILLPIFYALAIKSRKKWQAVFLHLVHLLGLWLLLLSASRTSFIAYLIAILAVIIFSSFDLKKFSQKLLWVLQRGLNFTLLLVVMIYFFGGDMKTRFEQVLRGYPQAYQTYSNSIVYLDYRVSDVKNFLRNLYQPEKPRDGIAFDNSNEDIIAYVPENNVLTDTDQRPRPLDVYEDIPDKVLVATDSGELVEVEQERTWSENALKYGLSFAIRLDELWPNAIKGFLKNPLLGSAYATLNKKQFQHFTEAESTDNNFLRTLGETGLLGFLTFYGAITLLLITLYKNARKAKQPLAIINWAFIAATLGLLVNASYIDVFASSKVAFTYWALAGAILAYNRLSIKDQSKKQHAASKKIRPSAD